MTTRPHVSWALASPAITGIADDDAPTSFYRRRPSARLRAQSIAPPPSRPPTSPPRVPRSRPPPSPATLLLPTGGPREVTSDGTILTPFSREHKRVPVDRRPRTGALAKLWRSLRLAASEDPALRGYGLLISAVALGLVGVLAVTYAYVTTHTQETPQRQLSAGHDSPKRDVPGDGSAARDSPARGPASDNSAALDSADHDRGFIDLACDLSRRLVRVQESRCHHGKP